MPPADCKSQTAWKSVDRPAGAQQIDIGAETDSQTCHSLRESEREGAYLYI